MKVWLPALVASSGKVAGLANRVMKVDWVSDITTVILDIDDTLYPSSSGFSGHRNGEVVGRFMTERLGFKDVEAALQVRDEYFRKYHSTLKGLTVACAEGKLGKPFIESELGSFWAQNCDFEKYLQRDPRLVKDLEDLDKIIVVFTNAPRAYGLRCLKTLGIDHVVQKLFGVEDVMPHCKPEKAAFEKVLKESGEPEPRQCVMVEDSMKNVRACHELGIRTVLIKETQLEETSEAALLGDLACDDDPAIDAVISDIRYLRATLPGLWT